MSKGLTDAWKAGKLKALRFYYVLYKNGHIGKANLIRTPDYYGFWNNCNLNDLIKEVLALVPDYDHFVELTEKVKELKRDIKVLTNNYKLLEKQQAENLAHGQALVDEFGDFEALYEEVVRLRKEVAKGDEIIGKLLNEGHAAIEKNKQLSCLLKECDSCVRTLRAFGVSDCNGSNLNELITRINAEIGESEEK